MKHILAVDIGATNARFGYFTAARDGKLALQESVWLSSRDARGYGDLLDQLKAMDFPLKPEKTDVASVAAAGPAFEKRFCDISNLDWNVDFTSVRQDFGYKRGLVINDFVAQAYACRTDAVAEAKVLQEGELNTDSPLAVIGAGTGLGHCGLLPDGHGGYLPVPSEGGHMTSGFVGRDEYEYEEFVLRETGRPYAVGDLVVTGLGLSLLHQFFTGEKLEPSEVAAKLGDNPRVVEWFARFYGRAARNYALALMAQGGVYLSGGVSAKNPVLAEHPAFLEEFNDSPIHHDVLKSISVFLNDNEESGLYGAALAGLHFLQA